MECTGEEPVQVRFVAGESSDREGASRTEDRSQGCHTNRRVTPVRLVARQFHSAAGDAALAGSDPAESAPATGQESDHQSEGWVAGTRERETGIGGQQHRGSERATNVVRDGGRSAGSGTVGESSGRVTAKQARRTGARLEWPLQRSFSLPVGGLAERPSLSGRSTGTAGKIDPNRVGAARASGSEVVHDSGCRPDHGLDHPCRDRTRYERVCECRSFSELGRVVSGQRRERG